MNKYYSICKRYAPALLGVGLLSFISWCWYAQCVNDKIQNDKICYTSKISLSGVITESGGHGIYQWVRIDNLDKSINIQVSKIKFTKGITDDYVNYQVGDSLIKEENSKEFIIKRDTCIAVYILSCDE